MALFPGVFAVLRCGIRRYFMKQKIGTLFILAGIVLSFMFWGSTGGSPPVFQWVFLGLLLIIWGIALIFRGREKTESQRFRTIRKLRGKKNDSAEE